MTEEITSPVVGGSSEGSSQEQVSQTVGQVVEGTPVNQESVPQETQTVSWFDSLSDDYKSDKSIASYKDKDLNEFAKDYLNKNAMIGKKGVVLPNAEDPEDVARYRKEMGIPEAADQYVSPEIEIPDDVKDYVDDSRIKGFKETAHKHGLTPEQYNGIVADEMAAMIASTKADIDGQLEKSNEAKTELRAEWQEKTDERIERAQGLIDKFVDDKSAQFFNDNNKNVQLIRFLDGLAQKFGSDSISNTGSGNMSITPQQAQSRMTEILANDAYHAQGIQSEETRALRAEYQDLSKHIR